MIRNCKKRKHFYSAGNNLIRSKRSRVPRNAPPRSDTIRRALFSEDDDDFIDFIEVSSFWLRSGRENNSNLARAADL